AFLRTRPSPCRALRTQRLDHRAGGQVERQTAQRAQRHCGASRWRRLVHRPWLRQHDELRRPQGPTRDQGSRLSYRPERRQNGDGNVWSAAGWVGDGYDGVHIFSPEGQRIGMILLPEICANLCFGGEKRNRLFMAASQSLYAVYVETQGAHIT